MNNSLDNQVGKVSPVMTTLAVAIGVSMTTAVCVFMNTWVEKSKKIVD